MAIRRVLTGMRPTGALHLGHYVGALTLWKDAQDEGELECFFLIADWQATSTHAHDPKLIQESVREVVLDWLSIGLDPTLDRVHFVLQSDVRERSELTMAFLMLAREAEVFNNPTLKEERNALKVVTMGFLTYPVDQVADIYMVSPPNVPPNELLVPVGEDQIAHLEYARKLARRFNRDYKAKVFRPCTPRVGKIGRLVGTDGESKMSKSMDNAIMLSDSPEEVERKVMKMFTDTSRIHATDPGHVVDNPLFMYHNAFNPDCDEIRDFKKRYRRGRVGDVEVKRRLAEVINDMLNPMRERRLVAETEPIIDYLIDGTERASQICEEVVASTKEAMFLGIGK